MIIDGILLLTYMSVFVSVIELSMFFQRRIKPLLNILGIVIKKIEGGERKFRVNIERVFFHLFSLNSNEAGLDDK